MLEVIFKKAATCIYRNIYGRSASSIYKILNILCEQAGGGSSFTVNSGYTNFRQIGRANTKAVANKRISIRIDCDLRAVSIIITARLKIRVEHEARFRMNG